MARRLAVCSWSLQPRDHDDLAGRLTETGVAAVQLALSPVVAGKGTLAERVTSVGELTRRGVGIVSGMMALAGEDYTTLETIARTGGLRPDSAWEANRAHAAAVAELAGQVGLSLVTFHAGFLPEESTDPEREKLLGRLREVADLFAAHGVTLGLETGQETAVTLVEALSALDRPNVGVNFDPANMILYGKGDPVEALTQLSPHVVQIHIKDARPTDVPGTWGTETPVGDGAVDWPAFLTAIGALPTDVDLVIEREAGGERAGDIRRAAECVRPLFQKSGCAEA